MSTGRSDDSGDYTLAGPVLTLRPTPDGFYQGEILPPYTQEELKRIIDKGEARLAALEEARAYQEYLDS